MKRCPKCGLEYLDTTTLCPADGVALETVDDLLIGKILAGKYRIDERLSGGGMGTVYRGTHVLMDKTVAIKVLRPSLQDILARQQLRASAHDRERSLAHRKANAEHQLSCVSSDFIQPDWVVDSSGLSVEEVYARHFAHIVN